MRFQVSKPSGYYFPQVEAFVATVTDTLKYWEAWALQEAQEKHTLREELVDCETRNATLQTQVELFRVQGDTLTHEDGSFVTESETGAAVTEANQRIVMLEQRVAAAEAQSARDAQAAADHYAYSQSLEARAVAAEQRVLEMQAAQDAAYASPAAPSATAAPLVVESDDQPSNQLSAPVDGPNDTPATAADHERLDGVEDAPNEESALDHVAGEGPAGARAENPVDPSPEAWTPPPLVTAPRRPLGGARPGASPTPIPEPVDAPAPAPEVISVESRTIIAPIGLAPARDTAAQPSLEAAAGTDGHGDTTYPSPEPAEALAPAQDPTPAEPATQHANPSVLAEADHDEMVFIDLDTVDPDTAPHYVAYEEAPTMASDGYVTIVDAGSELPAGTVMPPREPGVTPYKYNEAAPGEPLQAPGVPLEHWAPELDQNREF